MLFSRSLFSLSSPSCISQFNPVAFSVVLFVILLLDFSEATRTACDIQDLGVNGGKMKFFIWLSQFLTFCLLFIYS